MPALSGFYEALDMASKSRIFFFVLAATSSDIDAGASNSMMIFWCYSYSSIVGVVLPRERRACASACINVGRSGPTE